VREIRMLRSTRRGLETWHGRDSVTLADERARQRGTQTSTYTGAPVLDPTSQFFAKQVEAIKQAVKGIGGKQHLCVTAFAFQGFASSAAGV